MLLRGEIRLRREQLARPRVPAYVVGYLAGAYPPAGPVGQAGQAYKLIVCIAGDGLALR